MDFMTVEDAMPIVFSLAEQNALLECETVGDEALEDMAIAQQEAFEIVQEYIDTDYGSTMTRYTHDQIGDALDIVHQLASDNLLDEDYGDMDTTLLKQRIEQLRALNVIQDHIVNHFGED